MKYLITYFFDNSIGVLRFDFFPLLCPCGQVWGIKTEWSPSTPALLQGWATDRPLETLRGPRAVEGCWFTGRAPRFLGSTMPDFLRDGHSYL